MDRDELEGRGGSRSRDTENEQREDSTEVEAGGTNNRGKSVPSIAVPKRLQGRRTCRRVRD